MAKLKKTKPVEKTGKPAKNKLKPSAQKTKQLIKKSVKKTIKKKKEDLNCFLTTACVNYYELADNCYELTTLRNYRDTYLISSEEGKNLISCYYKVGPALIPLILKDKKHKMVFKFIYSEIKTACEEIE